MAEEKANGTGTVTMDDLKQKRFGIAISILGAFGTVVWATSKGKKGRFWWGLGGWIAGGAIGTIIDVMTSKK